MREKPRAGDNGAVDRRHRWRMQETAKTGASLRRMILLTVWVLTYAMRSSVDARDFSPQDIASRFFETVGQGESDAAYAMTSDEFRRSATQARLWTYLESYELTKLRELEWDRTTRTDEGVRLEGIATTTTDDRIALTLRMVEREGAWRLHRIDAKHAGEREIPDTDVLLATIRRDTQVFVGALEAGDMTAFRSIIAATWQSQVSAEQLLDTYQPLIAYLAPLKKATASEPTLVSTPRFDDNGFLVAMAFFRGDQKPALVQAKYHQEGSDWKLVGLTVNAR